MVGKAQQTFLVTEPHQRCHVEDIAQPAAWYLCEARRVSASVRTQSSALPHWLLGEDHSVQRSVATALRTPS